jgi:hypothetical protein
MRARRIPTSPKIHKPDMELSMNRNHLFRTITLAAGLLAAGAAGAGTVSECIVDVTGAKTDIAAANFLHEKDRVGLLGKADSAIAKLDKGKFADASTTLSAMSSQVASLVGAAKPKLGAADGAVISADIDTAKTCVVQLMTQ